MRSYFFGFDQSATELIILCSSLFVRHATAYKPEPARYVDKMSTSVPTVLLIQAIKRNPILWDSRLEEYKLSEQNLLESGQIHANEVAESTFVSIE